MHLKIFFCIFRSDILPKCVENWISAWFNYVQLFYHLRSTFVYNFHRVYIAYGLDFSIFVIQKERYEINIKEIIKRFRCSDRVDNSCSVISYPIPIKKGRKIVESRGRRKAFINSEMPLIVTSSWCIRNWTSQQYTSDNHLNW